MENEPTLFGNVAKSDIESAISNITRSERVIKVVDFIIKIDNTNFDAMDIFETLEKIDDEGNIAIINDSMVKALKKINVITSGGSFSGMMPAQKGENFHFFLDLLRKKLHE